MKRRSRGRRRANSKALLRGALLAAALLLLPVQWGCQAMIDAAADEMYDFVRNVGPGEVADWGALRAGIDNMAPQLMAALEVGTPPAPDEDEMYRLLDVYMEGAEDGADSRWLFPEGDSPMVVSPAPATIFLSRPPAPGR